MNPEGERTYSRDLGDQGVSLPAVVHWDLTSAELIERSIQNREGMLSKGGALVVRTGQFTGRSPKDKYIVRDATTETTVHWGSVNQPMSPDVFDGIHKRLLEFLKGRELFVQDCFGGADPAYSLGVRVITRKAWHSFFARQLFLKQRNVPGRAFSVDFTVIFAPDFEVDPELDGTRSKTCIAVNFTERLVLILGTEYAGEMKKSVFTILNYQLPERNVLPMHCSATAGPRDDIALFFGLSGTGKTTLSADPNRRLIGDDEHGWSDHGVFNFEGGCYAKCIGLSREREPQIRDAIRFGTVLENVVLDPVKRTLDFDADTYTENTRAAYPIGYIRNALRPGVAGHPSYVLFLTADAFGVLPPIARLTLEQSMYYFLSGYTAKVAGTERGLGSQPQATFSTCFGEPFLPRNPEEYARMLGERMVAHNATCYLVNTGWVGGPYGVGHRMDLGYTRTIVAAAIEGKLDKVRTRLHPVFRIAVPLQCPGVPAEVLDARGQWSDPAAYDYAAENLAQRFRENFKRFGPGVEERILMAAPVGV
jgi:phosphoenolpyruvate carboxykinase (ATP)